MLVYYKRGETMKKLLFTIFFVLVICSYTKSAPTEESLPVSITEYYCKMGKYNCWDIIKDIQNETQESPSNGKGAYNPALEKKGISIIRAYMSPGGNGSYDLSNNTHIYIDFDEFMCKHGTCGYTITDNASAKQITYDKEGNIVRYSPGSQPTPKPTPKPIKASLTESSCKINNYDCWAIIKDIKKETLISPSKKGAYNPALEKKGILITSYHKEEYSGSSQSYNLSNQVNITIHNDKLNEKRGTQGYITITDTVNKKLIIYDTKGNITNTKNFLSKSSCKLGTYDCWNIIQEIKKLSKANEEATSALRKKGILIISEDMFLDGGSSIYLLSNGVSVFINYEMFSDRRGNHGHTTITDPNTKKSITYDTKGNIVSFKK